MNNYGEKLKAIRAEFRLNQSDFAVKLSMKQSAYAMVECNTNGCSLQLLEKLFKDCNVNPRWFFLDEGNMFRGAKPEQAAPAEIVPFSPFHLIRVVSTLEKVILSYRGRLEREHSLNESQVNMIIDNYAAEAVAFNTSTDVKIVYNNEFTYHLVRS